MDFNVEEKPIDIDKKNDKSWIIIIAVSLFFGIAVYFIADRIINSNKSSTQVEETAKEKELDINDNTNISIKVVGDEKYGYISVPSNWVKFYDIDGNDSLQYSYANVFIISLNILDKQYSAKDYALNYMANAQNSNETTGVTGATVKIGKNKEYTAYQAYMYYPSISKYLITYWFEAEDGEVHYIALEGPESLNEVKLSDYLFIPESFSLKN